MRLAADAIWGFPLERRVVNHTHRPQGRGGWGGATPAPAPDGVWFYIDFHDPSSRAQIHTQPDLPNWTFRDKKAMLLLKEGANTRRLHQALYKILIENGVKDGPPDKSK